MVLSSSERDDLVRRVEQKLGRATVRRDVIRDAVDRTLGALPDGDAVPASADVPSADVPSADTSSATAIVAAVSTPDLASRLRRRLESAGVVIGEMAAATEGRFTVVAVGVSPACADSVRGAAEALGARLSWRGV